nr:hypothetical protein CFP56_47958 [Quercus suber]
MLSISDLQTSQFLKSFWQYAYPLLDHIGCFGTIFSAPVHRVTRSYYRKKENEGKVSEAEVSELSCVESNSEFDAGVFVERSSKLKSKNGKLNEIMEEIEGNEGSEAVSKSKISFVEQFSDGILNFSDGNVKVNSEFNENEVVSVAPATKLAEEATEQVEDRASEFSFP